MRERNVMVTVGIEGTSMEPLTTIKQDVARLLGEFQHRFSVDIRQLTVKVQKVQDVEAPRPRSRRKR